MEIKNILNESYIEKIYILLNKLQEEQSYSNKEEGLEYLEDIYSKEKISLWDKDIVLTYWDNSNLIGFGRAKHNGWITHIFVDNPYQNKGIGSKMLKKLEDDLIKENHNKIYLNSEPSEISFYENRGWKRIKQEPENYHGILLIPMEKEIK